VLLPELKSRGHHRGFHHHPSAKGVIVMKGNRKKKVITGRCLWKKIEDFGSWKLHKKGGGGRNVPHRHCIDP